MEINTDLESQVMVAQQRALLANKIVPIVRGMSSREINLEDRESLSHLETAIDTIRIPEGVGAISAVLAEIPALVNSIKIRKIDGRTSSGIKKPSIFADMKDTPRLQALSGYVIELNPPTATQRWHDKTSNPDSYMGHKGYVSQFLIIGYSLGTSEWIKDYVFIAPEPREVLDPKVRPKSRLTHELFDERTQIIIGAVEKRDRKRMSNLGYLISEIKNNEESSIANFLTGSNKISGAMRTYQTQNTVPLLAEDKTLPTYFMRQYQDYLLDHPFIRAVLDR